jgi:tetratricopeptide (TPR) repeat protein
MERALALSPQLDEARVAQAAIFYATGELEEAIKTARGVVERRPDCEGAYYQLLRALFGAGRYEEIAELAEAAIEASGDDYNVYVPIGNALGALGRADAGLAMRRRRLAALERHLLQVPEDARARILLASDYAAESRTEDALRELQLAMVLRPNEPTVLYNAACAFCSLKMKVEALDALSKAWQAGYRDTKWARRDPDLVLLRGDSEFERLFPEKGSDE